MRDLRISQKITDDFFCFVKEVTEIRPRVGRELSQKMPFKSPDPREIEKLIVKVIAASAVIGGLIVFGAGFVMGRYYSN